jgi:6-phosphogluconolactonase (cycloisomerase 2 family)
VLTRIATTLGLVTLGLAGTLTQLPTASASPEVAGYVFVNLNTSPANTIAGFARHTDGSLSPLSGSPFAVGGVGKAVASQGSLQEATAGDNHYLLATDGGSSQISSLLIASDGSLHPVTGSPFASHDASGAGTTPNSIAVHGNLVYVSNAGDGATAGTSNYTGFTLSSSGGLSPLAGSTFTLATTAAPGDVLFSSTGTHLIGTEVGPSAGPSFIDSFNVGSGGLITLASHFPAQGVGSFGSEFRPTNPSQLYVSNAHNGANAATVSALNVASNGALSSIGASPYADKQTAACWVEISRDGRYLYAVNTAVPSISRYRILDDGALSLLGSTAFNLPTGLGPVDARLDPTGHTLYVVDSGADAVSAFRVRGAHLAELDSSPFALPAGAKPFGIVAISAGEDG